MKQFEYVKVLLCLYPKLKEEARELDRLILRRAVCSAREVMPCDQIAEEILLVRMRKENYLQVQGAITKTLDRLPRRLRDAVGYRFFREPAPDVAKRTLYRRTLEALAFIEAELERMGYSEEWFLETFGPDEEAMFRYRYYRERRKCG